MPRLRRNLISLGALDSYGYIVKLDKGRSIVVLKGLKENGLYILQGKIVSVTGGTTSVALAISTKDNTKL